MNQNLETTCIFLHKKNFFLKKKGHIGLPWPLVTSNPYKEIGMGGLTWYMF